MRTWQIWRFSDNKPGHDTQSQGLIKALKKLQAVHSHDISIQVNTHRKQLPKLPRPDLLIGAGNSTHIPLLAANWRYGGRSIVLMKPSLIPYWFFDLCIIPRHDGMKDNSKIITTYGVLNTVEPQSQQYAQQHDNQGLFLIGGPSKHHSWSDKNMVAQITMIATATPDRQWLLTSSRRTPAGFIPLLQKQQPANLQIFPASQTQPDWVMQQLKISRQVWVSEDSISMIFEALTAGAEVGCLEVPAQRNSRVLKAVQELRAAHLLTSYTQWQTTQQLTAPQNTLYEAMRCARHIEQHWLSA